MRWKSGLVYGLSCWDSSSYNYEEYDEPKFTIIDLIAEKMNVKLSYDDYRKIESMKHENFDNDDKDYYGNGGDYQIRYIILSQLENYLTTK